MSAQSPLDSENIQALVELNDVQFARQWKKLLLKRTHIFGESMAIKPFYCTESCKPIHKFVDVVWLPDFSLYQYTGILVPTHRHRSICSMSVCHTLPSTLIYCTYEENSGPQHRVLYLMGNLLVGCLCVVCCLAVYENTWGYCFGTEQVCGGQLSTLVYLYTARHLHTWAPN